jgi:hypothetical protein
VFANIIYIHRMRGRIVAVLLVIISVIAAPIISSYSDVLGEAMVDGLINFVCYPIIIVGMLINGYYHSQYIKNEIELIEKYGYFFWESKQSVLVDDIREIRLICVWRRHQGGRKMAERLMEIVDANGSIHKQFSDINSPKLIKELNRLNDKIVISRHSVTQQVDEPKSAPPA